MLPIVGLRGTGFQGLSAVLTDTKHLVMFKPLSSFHKCYFSKMLPCIFHLDTCFKWSKKNVKYFVHDGNLNKYFFIFPYQRSYQHSPVGNDNLVKHQPTSPVRLFPGYDKNEYSLFLEVCLMSSFLLRSIFWIQGGTYSMGLTLHWS